MGKKTCDRFWSKRSLLQPHVYFWTSWNIHQCSCLYVEHVCSEDFLRRAKHKEAECIILTHQCPSVKLLNHLLVQSYAAACPKPLSEDIWSTFSSLHTIRCLTVVLWNMKNDRIILLAAAPCTESEKSVSDGANIWLKLERIILPILSLTC